MGQLHAFKNARKMKNVTCKSRGGSRENAGRKKLPVPSQVISLRVPGEMLSLVKMYADFYNTSQSRIIIRAIQRYLDAQCV